MEMFLNKKYLNRISRKNATIIPPQNTQKSPYSTIATFRQIKQTKKLLQEPQLQKKPAQMVENVLNYCQHLSLKRKHYSLLSRPKVNFKQQNCQRNIVHEKLFQTAREKLSKTSRKSQAMNRTISFSVQRHQSRIKSLYEQEPIDLQRDEFRRRQESLIKHEHNLGQELSGIYRNTMISNELGKLRTTEIIQMKQRQQMQKDFLMGLTKFGQSLSNQVAESEEMREFFTALPSGKSLDENERRKMIEEHMVGLHEGLQKPVVEKYKTLLGTIQDSQSKFPTESYEDYDKALSSKYGSGRTRKRPSKILLNCAQEWR